MTKLISRNPSNGEVLGEVEISTEKEIEEKVKMAHDAKNSWKFLGINKRVNLLRKIPKEFSKRKEILAQLASKEMGMPISQSRYDVDDSVRYFNWYLDNAEKYLKPEVVYEDEVVKHTVYCEPYGVVAIISPWNFPLSNFVWMVAQNLIAGNIVIFKHSEEVPLFGKMLEDVINKCGLPEGVFSELYGAGEVGDSLVHKDINLIHFTGSVKTGRYLYKVAAKKFIKAVLELGGSAPGIVFKDANIDRVLESIYANRFTNCGQMCDALKRLIVHESKFDEVVRKLRDKLEKVKVGNSLDESVEIGPLVSEKQLKTLEDQMKDAVDKGAKVIIGGKKLDKTRGWFYSPTLLINIKKEMRVWQEEVFGPVLPIVSFKTDNGAVELANATKYGLGAYLFTDDKEKAQGISLKLETGMVSVNNTSYLQPCSPFGGYKESGMGREHGKFGFYDLTQVKVAAEEK